MNGETAQGSRIFQLSSETTPEGVKAISPQLAASLATAHGVTLRRSIDYTLLPDSLGYYRGTTDSIYQPNGHGCWQGYDGTYYEGYWKNGKREGFGFSIAPKKPLRIGEWKNDRYKGERLVYTSERIYGIDLSKYQHGKGRKNMLSIGTVYALHILAASAKDSVRNSKLPDSLHLYQEYRR